MDETEAQRTQTYEYFTKEAQRWHDAAQGLMPDRVNVVAQRNAAVKEVVRRLGSVERAVDLGCGSGELCHELAGEGIAVTGVDFSEEMIKLCEETRDHRAPIAPEFIAKDIFEYVPSGPETVDLVAALGLIEYLEYDQIPRLLSHVAGMLRSGGAFAVGSRNRLFNLFSGNDFTNAEIDLGTVQALMSEALILSASDGSQWQKTPCATQAPDFPRLAEHPRTAIEVDVRHQLTPLMLIAMGEGMFEAEGIFHVHFHALPPSLKAEALPAHVSLSQFVHTTFFDDPRAVPYSSSFVLHLRRL